MTASSTWSGSSGLPLATTSLANQPREFFDPYNIAIKLNEPLAGAAADGSAAAGEETAGACGGAGTGAGGGADAVAKPGQDRETDLKANLVVLEFACITATANAPLSGGSVGCSLNKNEKMKYILVCTDICRYVLR